MNLTALDAWMVAAALLSALSCALLGNFLLVRRLSLMGDAISHAVLPGLAIAFLVTGSRDAGPMLLGAILAGLLTALLTQGIAHAGRVEENASMGVVFTTLFALGLVLIVRAADKVDLDPSCVLYGALELTPLDTMPVAGWVVPRAVVMNAAVLAVNLLVVRLFFKELTIGAFDPLLAETQGFRPRWMHQLLMALVALTAVACFETVGSILVVAMLVVPAAAARLLAHRLPGMIVWSLVLAAASAVLGHLGALVIPGWFGYADTTTAGMMAVAAGGLFLLALVFAPQEGLVARAWNQTSLRMRIAMEDALAALYRREEAGREMHPLPADFWLRRLWRRGFTEPGSNGWRLTPRGREEATGLIRSHRLWERYLVDQANVNPGQAHHASERLEHVTTHGLREDLDAALDRPLQDPHGREIPPR
ncbi:MAG TPA: metal ABC transporter permease [Kiritimatiellia bacterium]|nr:metal ABC transporter permease [Kiritimatiellia bacterium]